MSGWIGPVLNKVDLIFSKKCSLLVVNSILPENFADVFDSVFYENIAFQESDTNFETGEIFGLRWFTPTNEVPLCGHATLAAATVLFRVST